MQVCKRIARGQYVPLDHAVPKAGGLSLDDTDETTVDSVITHTPRWIEKPMGYDRVMGCVEGTESILPSKGMGYDRLWVTRGMG